MTPLELPSRAPNRVEIRQDCQGIYDYLLSAGPKTAGDIKLELELSGKEWVTRKRYLIENGFMRISSGICPHCGQGLKLGQRWEACSEVEEVCKNCHWEEICAYHWRQMNPSGPCQFNPGQFKAKEAVL